MPPITDIYFKVKDVLWKVKKKYNFIALSTQTVIPFLYGTLFTYFDIMSLFVYL